jgi:hypothetical protein
MRLIRGNMNFIRGDTVETNAFKVKVVKDGLNTRRGEVHNVKAASVECADYYTIVDYGRLHGASILIKDCEQIKN